MSDNIQFIPKEDLEYKVAPMGFSIGDNSGWGILMCNIEKYWELSKGAGILVGVLDTGIVDHTDLPQGKAWGTGLNCTGENSFFDSGSGHGVHVSGIIGAREDGKGIVGVAPECTILPIKVLNRDGSGSYESIAKGIRAAINANCDILNLSLGSPSEPPQEIHYAIKEAADKGMIIVAAAGNDGGDVCYPAKYEEVIAVAAMDKNGRIANFSSHGQRIAVAAPGVDIYSTHFNNGYATMSGTSQASPFIAGICALLLSYSRSNPGVELIKGYVDMIKALNNLLAENPMKTADGYEYGVPNFINIDPSKYKNVVVQVPMTPDEQARLENKLI